MSADSYGSTDNRTADSDDEKAPQKIIALPTTVKLRTVAGVKKVINVTPTLMFGLLGDSPPGGWYGQFGFLRMVAYAFFSLACVGAICLLLALRYMFTEGVVPVLSALLLVAASFVAAAAAYSHEGLAVEAAEQAKLNDRFADLNDNFDQQLDELADVASALEKWAERGEGTYQHLLTTVTGLQRVNALAKVNTIIRAFTDAEMRQYMMEDKKANKRLSTQGELNVFFDGSSDILKANLPELDIGELKRLALRGGIGLTITSLIIAAVLNGDSEQEMMRSTGMMALAHFILDPKESDRYDEANVTLTAILKNDLKYQSKDAVKRELRRMEKTADGSAGSRVPEIEARPLAKAVLCLRNQQASNDVSGKLAEV